MRYKRMLPRVEELAGPTMKRRYFPTALGSVRESRRGGRNAIRPNVPGPKRSNFCHTNSPVHARNKVDPQRRY